MHVPLYQCLILGSPTDHQLAALTATLRESLASFGLSLGKEVIAVQAFSPEFDDTVPTACIYFGTADSTLDSASHARLIRLGIPVIPCVTSVERVGIEIPEQLRGINALTLDPLDKALEKPVGVVLQCLGLLPSQRRVFISYRRKESTEVALQLFEALSAKNFDVFLDTHSVAPAADFQAMLWHRLCDCDVVVMLDTPGYFKSRWTTIEWGRAIDKKIGILQLVWPEHTPSRGSALATQFQLVSGDFNGAHLTEQVVNLVGLHVEQSRSRSIVLRHTNIAGGLRSAFEGIGGTFEGVGPRRAMLFKLPSGVPIVAYPTVGVPTALTVHEAQHLGSAGSAVVVYDHVGLSEQWMEHVRWLGSSVKAVKWLRSREVGWELPELEGI